LYQLILGFESHVAGQDHSPAHMNSNLYHVSDVTIL